MAKIANGNPLTTPLLLEGSTVNNDGYGLLTGQCRYALDSGQTNPFSRGDAHPFIPEMKVHKLGIQYKKLTLALYTLDYVGIVSTVNSGNRTNPQVTGSTGLTTEHITTHPNFFTLATGFTGNPIAGVGTGTLTAPVYPASSITPGEYEGNNGAHFEKSNGGKFLGFKKPNNYLFYGKTNYLSPITSFSGMFYTKQGTDITDLRACIGKTSGTNSFASIKLLPDYIGTSFTIGTSPVLNQLLLAQMSFEDFGTLYKISYEIRYNREGYPAQVYAGS